MKPKMVTKDSHICHMLYARQCTRNADTIDRLTSKMVHQVILQPSMKFEIKWKKTSNQSVCIGLDRRMYFDTHSKGYLNDGYNGVPHKLYSIPMDGQVKHSSAILYYCHIRHKPTTPEESEVCLLTLTSDGYLKIFNADTGEVLRSVYISTNILFKYLSWAEYLETIQVKSVQAKNAMGVVDPSHFISIILFKIHPLNLIAKFHISKQIFGNDIRDVSVTDDLMIVTTPRTCRYYSLQWILDNCNIGNAKLNETYYDVRNNAAYTPGVYPNGIPNTINITSHPPVLFETSCNPARGVVFGGSPMVYLHNSKASHPNDFHLKLLKSGKQIDTISTDIVAFHHDAVSFHFEDYQRLLHVSGCTLRCYQLVSNSTQLQLQYLVDFKKEFSNDTNNDDSDQPLVSSRGRIIKKIITNSNYYGDFTSAVQDVDFENELDLLHAVITVPEGEQTSAYFCFIDDTTGSITKTIPLPSWAPDCENNIYYELDCIIHLCKSFSKSMCYFYRLTRT